MTKPPQAVILPAEARELLQDALRVAPGRGKTVSVARTMALDAAIQTIRRRWPEFFKRSSTTGEDK